MIRLRPIGVRHSLGSRIATNARNASDAARAYTTASLVSSAAIRAWVTARPPFHLVQDQPGQAVLLAYPAYRRDDRGALAAGPLGLGGDQLPGLGQPRGGFLAGADRGAGGCADFLRVPSPESLHRFSVSGRGEAPWSVPPPRRRRRRGRRRRRSRCLSRR